MDRSTEAPVAQVYMFINLYHNFCIFLVRPVTFRFILVHTHICKICTYGVLFSESSNFKKKKSAKQKAQAGSSHNWNSLFLGHDAVADVIADTYGTTKEAVVGPEGKGSAAVRLALGETQIVAQTRKYLEQEGVILDAFKNVRFLYVQCCIKV